MAYAGLQNKRIVELLQQNGVNAVGLSGIDGRAVQGRRNKGIRVRKDGKTLIVRTSRVSPGASTRICSGLLLDHGYRPVLSIPILDESRTAINSENDDIVNALQAAFHARVVLQLIDRPGSWRQGRREHGGAAHPRGRAGATGGQVAGRMKRKMLALRRLFEEGAEKVVMSDGRVEHPVRDALAGKGTVIQ